MKRFLSLLFCAVLLVCVLPTASAAGDEATEAANTLYQLGLFKGKSTDAYGRPDYALDDAPTRHEAVTMLVRLLGKEAEAKAGSWEIPFTDVADWAKPYVGYAYANKLTSGTSKTTFSGNSKVNATQYITFVLRALGYSSKTDFSWDKAWELSDELGITDGRFHSDSGFFSRGDTVIISAAALDARLKNTGESLLTSLEKAGAINRREMIYLTTSGKPAGEAAAVQYGEISELASGTGTIHSVTSQPLHNGYTRFTVDYTMPKGLRIFIFDAPNGQNLSLWDNRGTTGQKSQLVFDVESSLLPKIGNLMVNFFTADNNRFFLNIGMGGSSGGSTGNRIEPTNGSPIGAAEAMVFENDSRLSSGTGAIHSFTMQPLDNGHTRFAVDYTMPAGLNIEIIGFDLLDNRGTTDQRSTLVFDVQNSALREQEFLTVKFFDDSGSSFFTDISLRMLWPTDGKPVGASVSLKYLKSSNIGTVHSLTRQALDNGHTRFLLEHTMPKGLKAIAYNPPAADKLNIREDRTTTGQRSTLILDVENSRLAKIDCIVINFYRSGGGDCMVEFNPNQ